MTAQKWKRKIKKALVDAGTYKNIFDAVIESLSDILEQRDRAREQFDRSGGNIVISYTNKGGATNPAKNPCLVAWDDLNATALSYWRELGLTPSSLKKMTGSSAPAEAKESGLAAALKAIETD